MTDQIARLTAEIKSCEKRLRGLRRALQEAQRAANMVEMLNKKWCKKSNEQN